MASVNEDVMTEDVVAMWQVYVWGLGFAIRPTVDCYVFNELDLNAACMPYAGRYPTSVEGPGCCRVYKCVRHISARTL